jgi:hypothetical protein
MAVLALAKDDRDMRARLGRMIVARSTKSGRHGSPALLCPDLLIAVPLWTLRGIDLHWDGLADVCAGMRPVVVVAM